MAPLGSLAGDPATWSLFQLGSTGSMLTVSPTIAVSPAGELSAAI